MPALAETIRRELSRWNLGAIEESIFGTADPDRMAGILDRYCSLHLGAGAAGGLFYFGSAGCASGIRLQTGDEIAIKAYQERWTASYLSAVQSVQADLCAEGFPCPRPLVPPRPLQPGRHNLAMAELLPGRSRHEATRRVRGLRVLGRRFGPPGHALSWPFAPRTIRSSDFLSMPRPVVSIRSPTVLSSISKGHRRVPTGSTVTRRGHRSLRAADDSTPVVAHMDWSARNIRIGPRGLVAAYDWDSLALVPESTAIGQAAATWCVTSEPGGSEFPSLEGITEFVLRYEEEAGRSFDEVQWRATGAAAAYVLAYTARCEDSLEAAGLARPHQRGGRDRLAEAGEGLLSFARP